MCFNSLLIKIANERRLNLQLEHVLFIIVGGFIVLQTRSDKNKQVLIRMNHHRC